MADSPQQRFLGRPMPTRAFPAPAARDPGTSADVRVAPGVVADGGGDSGPRAGRAGTASGSVGGSALAVLLPPEPNPRSASTGRLGRARAASTSVNDRAGERVEDQGRAEQAGTTAGPLCLKCRDKQYVLVPQGDHVRARVCTCRKPCSVCQGRGYVIRQAPNAYLYYADCVCRTFLRRIERFNQAQVPAHFARCELGSFETSRHNAQVLQRALEYATHFTPGQPEGLLLYGDPGVGKSHLAVGILKVLVFEKGVQCLFKDFFLLLSEVRNAYNEGRFDSELLRPLTEVEVLIIDELGKGRSHSDWEQALLDEIICRRYNQLKATLFTTNFPLPDDQEAAPRTQGRAPGNLSSQLERPNLEERIGDRMFSRLKQMCSMLKVTGQDYRKTHTINSLQGRKL